MALVRTRRASAVAHQDAPPVLKFYLDDGGRLIEVRRVDGKLKRFPHRAEWSMFVRAEHFTLGMRRYVETSKYLKGMRREEEWVRLMWEDSETCEQSAALIEREFNVPTFDVVVPPWLRRCIDHGAKFEPNPRRCFVDIESDSRLPWRKRYDARMLTWSVRDAEGNHRQGVLQEDTPEAERALIAELLEALEAYDQVAAWNGDRFDFPYLRARMRRVALSVDLRRWLLLDHLVVFKKMNMHASESGEEKQSYALDVVARAQLGERAGKLGFDASKTWAAWENSTACGDPGGENACMACRACLLAYNAHDTLLMVLIEQKTAYLELFRSVCQVCGVQEDSVGSMPVARVESFLLRLGATHGRRFRHHVRAGTLEPEGETEDEEKFKGAMVMRPTGRGILKGVHVFDFSKMYPSIILSWNISPDTIVESPPPPRPPPIYLRHSPAWKQWEKDFKAAGIPPDNVVVAPLTGSWFTRERRGMLPLAVEEIIRLRDVWSEREAQEVPGTSRWLAAHRMNSALKIVLNAFFGVAGSPASRFYDRAVGEAIAQAGVWLIQRTLDEARKRGFVPLYSDTDSGFVQGLSDEALRAFVAECNEVLYPEWMRAQGCWENRIEVAYEKKFERLVFPLSAQGDPVAKRYCGAYEHFKGKRATAESEPEIKGLEYKRGDSARLARQFQREVVDLLMREKCEDSSTFFEVVSRWRDRVLNDELTLEDCVLSSSLNKPLHEYARKPKKHPIDAGIVQVLAETQNTVRVRLADSEAVTYKRTDIHASSPVPGKLKSGPLLLIDWNEGPAHVRIARELAKRGADVGVESKIRYVVIDGKASPKKLIPAEDWTGEVDRYDFWESRVWPPTMRVLSGAFPGTDWRVFSKVRPASPRAPRKGRARVAPGQGSLF